MALFPPADRPLITAIGQLGFVNPFLPERIELERLILGDQFVAGETVWSMNQLSGSETENLEQISLLAARVVSAAQLKLAKGVAASKRDLQLYVDLALYHLFDQFRSDFHQMIAAAHTGKKERTVTFWKKFSKRHDELFAPCGEQLPMEFDMVQLEASHLLACFFQVRRAFFHVFYFIVGGSASAARLRAAIWESIFSHDLRRYQRTLFRHMDDVTTLITGPSGTGKELVARAIGLSCYIPFDALKGRFAKSFVDSFQAVNLSALSPTLIESELFGHRRGTFTGAVADRVGWFAACGPHGAVFLDEIGELDGEIQVKLLRVLQSRCFQRLGDTDDLAFEGKILAATNRDLMVEIESGRFREDFYYRLCADRVETPTLRDQLNECPEDLERLVLFIARRVAPEEAASLAGEVSGWVTKHLGRNYAWPGNVRELEQCFRNIMIHGEYRPAMVAGSRVSLNGTDLLGALQAGQLTAEELLQHYCRHVYKQCGSFEQTAQRLKLDRRTVKRKIVEGNADS